MSGSAYEPELPLLPYAGTSGWSGSDTSEERARTADTDGTTTRRQAQALATLRLAGAAGATWKELADLQQWHHGTASGVLSVLHKEGRVARLTDRRHGCAIYVLPEAVGNRLTAAHGRKRPPITDEQVEAALAAWTNADRNISGRALVRLLLEAAADA
jgi:DNA-binding MarR family transcriptional regulator